MMALGLPFVLSMIAGSVDTIGFLALGGLFTAHVTGNLVILAARLLAGEPAPVAHLLSVPIFVAMLVIARLLVSGLEELRTMSLEPLLLLQLLLLAGCTGICINAAPNADPATATLVIAGMLGVSAMAVQNALVRISLTGAPSTAVMTTNITTFAMDVGEVWLGRNPTRAEEARNRARQTWPALVGFLLGCALGASCEAALGLSAMVLPTSLALGGLVLGRAFTQGRARNDR
jgi:uncharacterized membrane protein YoaK (UPF0700 family)